MDDHQEKNKIYRLDIELTEFCGDYPFQGESEKKTQWFLFRENGIESISKSIATQIKIWTGILGAINKDRKWGFIKLLEGSIENEIP